MTVRNQKHNQSSGASAGALHQASVWLTVSLTELTRRATTGGLLSCGGDEYVRRKWDFRKHSGQINRSTKLQGTNSSLETANCSVQSMSVVSLKEKSSGIFAGRHLAASADATGALWMVRQTDQMVRPLASHPVGGAVRG